MKSDKQFWILSVIVGIIAVIIILDKRNSSKAAIKEEVIAAANISRNEKVNTIAIQQLAPVANKPVNTNNAAIVQRTSDDSPLGMAQQVTDKGLIELYQKYATLREQTKVLRGVQDERYKLFREIQANRDKTFAEKRKQQAQRQSAEKERFDKFAQLWEKRYQELKLACTR